MSQIVRCDICGQIYNQSYLNAHKRLAHPKKPGPTASAKNEPEVQEKIVALYERLSDQSKQEVRNRLDAAAEIPGPSAVSMGRKRRSRPPATPS